VTDLWGRKMRSPDRGYCRGCDEWFEPEAERELADDGRWVVAFYLLPFECPWCGAPLVRESRRRPTASKVEPEAAPLPAAPREGGQRKRCRWDGRFLRRNRTGRPPDYCNRACQQKAYRRRKQHPG